MALTFGNKNVAGAYFGNKKVAKIYFGNKLVYPKSTTRHYDGLTYVTNGTANAQFDLYPGHDKQASFTITQVDGSFSATITNNNGRTWSSLHYNNCTDIYAPSAGTYTLVQTNYTSFTAYNLEYFNDSMSNVVSLLSFDGYGKTSITGINDLAFASVTSLPSEAINYNNCQNLTTITKLFKNTHPACSLIPVIEAMLEAAPNLNVTSGNWIFDYNYCGLAPDLEEAYNKYPYWFSTPERHVDFTVNINPYTSGDSTITWSYTEGN